MYTCVHPLYMYIHHTDTIHTPYIHHIYTSKHPIYTLYTPLLFQVLLGMGVPLTAAAAPVVAILRLGKGLLRTVELPHMYVNRLF